MTESKTWRKSSYSGPENDCVEVATWRKSSHSGPQNDCVEVGTWSKSSYSGAENACVELMRDPYATAIRDTKDRDGGTLTLTTPTFTAFLTTLKAE